MSEKSRRRRLARKYPRAPRIVPAPLDLDAAIYGGYAPIEATTVELLDEGDPDGPVVFRDERGYPTMWMPRAVYEQLRAMPPESFTD